jgi:diketogulonate reductase-like aldo/keto reductase
MVPGSVMGIVPDGSRQLPAIASNAEMTAMLTRPIPSTGEKLPVIGLGTWQTFDVRLEAGIQDQLGNVLTGLVAGGGRLVDSSPMYGRAESVVGTLAADLGIHPQLFLATKVWTNGRTEGIRQMEDSLRKLRIETVDLMQVHNLVDVETHLDTLQDWKAEGRVRYIGVTHYTASAHESLARLIVSKTVDFLQVNYSVAEPEAARRLLPLAQERGVAVLINRPFGGGGLLRRLRNRPLPAWAAEMGYASWSALLLAFVLAQPAVTCVIPATSQASHLQENLQAGIVPLPDAGLLGRLVAEVDRV